MDAPTCPINILFGWMDPYLKLELEAPERFVKRKKLLGQSLSMFFLAISNVCHHTPVVVYGKSFLIRVPLFPLVEDRTSLFLSWGIPTPLPHFPSPWPSFGRLVSLRRLGKPSKLTYQSRLPTLSSVKVLFPVIVFMASSAHSSSFVAFNRLIFVVEVGSITRTHTTRATFPDM